jgi:hypothetical protein
MWTYLVSKMRNRAMKILPVLTGIIQGFIYAKGDKAPRALGFGLVLMETYFHCTRNSRQRV